MNQITVRVAGNLTITGLSDAKKKAFLKKFRIENQAYIFAVKKGKFLGNIPRYISYANINKNGDLVLPRGLARYVAKSVIPTNTERRVVWNYNECVDKYYGYETTKELRPYQKPVVEDALKRLNKKDRLHNNETSGLLCMGTGTGKTITSLAIACALSQTITIIVPNLTLLNQWVEEIRAFVDGFSNPLAIGVFSGKERRICPITVATWQSLVETTSPEVQTLIKATGTLIIDEAHGVTSPARRKTLEAFRPSYLLGLTATPDRTDGQGEGVRYLLGHTLANYSATELTPEIEVIRTGVPLAMSDQYHEMVEGMAKNDDRNRLIIGLLLGELLKGRKVLVITKRIEHYRNLEKFMPAFEGIFYIDSEDPERHELMRGFKYGDYKFNAIFGTTSLLSVGADVPQLDTIIMACDIKSSVLTTQSVGRILRVFEGKQSPKIIDLWDDFNPVFSRQFHARQELYLKKGWLKEPVMKYFPRYANHS